MQYFERRWQKSSFSGGGDGAECLEVACRERGTLALREGDTPDICIAAPRGALADLLRHLKGRAG